MLLYKTTLQNRRQSFGHAFDGLQAAWQTEPNLRIHAATAVLVFIAGLVFRLNNTEWLAIIASIGFVITIELLNTAIEKTLDHLHPQKHIAVKKIKDIAAAAVLTAAITAAVTGGIIFLPKIFTYASTFFSK